MRRHLLFLLPLMAGCQGTRYGYSVDVTITADPTFAARAADVQSLSIHVDGDASVFDQTYPITNQLTGGAVRWVYLPTEPSGALDFRVAANSQGLIIGSGDSGPVLLVPGGAASASVVLHGESADLGSPADLTAPPDLGERDLAAVDLLLPDLATRDLTPAPDDLTAPDDLMCTNGCPSPGAERCVSGEIETCTSGGACLQWSMPATCPATTPTCSAALQTCVGTLSSCSTAAMGFDPATQKCVTCLSPGAQTPLWYVDSAAAVGSGTGTPECPFRTVTAALAVVNTSGVTGQTIQIAAGTYDSALGENFPIILRRGVSLIGAGAATTTLEGEGSNSGNGSINSTRFATVVAGDVSGLPASTLRGLTLVPTVSNSLGVWCDRGNAGPFGSPPPTSPPPSLVLDQLTIGPGYDKAVVASTDVSFTGGCNLAVTGSTLSGNNTGVYALSCTGSGLGSLPVAVQVGGLTPSSGNRFQNVTEGDGLGCALQIVECVSPALFFNNLVDGGECGVRIDSTPNSFDRLTRIESNSFRDLHNVGVLLQDTAYVDFLNGNSFSNISATTGRIGAGLALDSAGATGFDGPQVREARGNSFVGNDIGISISGNPLSASSSPPRDAMDFGNAGDAGGNSFSCNSGAIGAGYDVWVHPNGDSSATLSFEGNLWDFAPPSSGGSGAPDGTDVACYSATGGIAATVDSNGASPVPTPSPTPCPGNRVH